MVRATLLVAHCDGHSGARADRGDEGASPGGTTSSIQLRSNCLIVLANSIASCAVLKTQLQSIPSQQSGPIVARAA